jgi:mannan endo-1,4-beta-mannosidase
MSGNQIFAATPSDVSYNFNDGTTQGWTVDKGTPDAVSVEASTDLATSTNQGSLKANVAYTGGGWDESRIQVQKQCVVGNDYAIKYDIFIPNPSTFTGQLKVNTILQKGDGWTWTPGPSIQTCDVKSLPTVTINKVTYGVIHREDPITNFLDKTTPENPLTINGLIIDLAGSGATYTGPIYIDDVTIKKPGLDPITFDFSTADSAYGWAGSKYDYNYTAGPLNPTLVDGAMKLDVNYSKDVSWSEPKLTYTFAQQKELEGYNKFSFDFIYDPAKMTTGSFKAKLSAGNIGSGNGVDTPIDTTNAVVYGNGFKKATVQISFPSAANIINDFTIGLVGSSTDYKGSVYIDNVTFSPAAVDSYVDATKVAEAQTPITVNSDSIVANGTTQSTLSNVKLVDDKAIANTAKLYAYLEAIGKTDSVLYGHQNDTTHKAGNSALSNSDTKDMTGSVSGVMGIDALSLTGNELSTAAWNDTQANRVAACVTATEEAAKQGAVITLSAHMPNFEVIKERVENDVKGSTDQNKVGILSDGSYNFSGYTPGTLTGNVVSRIMPGQDLNKYYTAYLDMIAQYANALGKDGISVLFRPFHENTGSWFWWGKAFCDEESFKNLYKYTVEYLRDKDHVHNFIYVYGPSSDAESTADYAKRYPGDAYVDMVGFDMYHQNPSVGDNFIDQFKTELGIVQDFAKEHNKLFAVTETGVANPNNQALLKSGNARKDWYNEILGAVADTNASYFMLWANFGEGSGFYEPYVMSKPGESMRGHEMLDNFIDFYNKANSVFGSQVGDITKISTTVEPNTDITGYVTAPVSGSRVIDATKVVASVSNVKDANVIKFVAKNKTGDVVKEITTTKDIYGNYEGDLTKDILASLGETMGTISLVVDGKVCNTINAKFNMLEPVVDPTVVDNFESYYGEDAVMNTSWSTGKGTGCTIVPSLSSSNKYEGDYGLKFKYSLVAGGYVGVTKSLNGADWSSKNALQLWTIPDGKNQKIVVQITSGKNVFEVYLNNYKEYADSKDPLLLTIPFTSFVGRDDKTAVFDPKDIESFGLWCNTIGDTAVDSSIYYDSIKAVTSDVKEVTFSSGVPVTPAPTVTPTATPAPVSTSTTGGTTVTSTPTPIPTVTPTPTPSAAPSLVSKVEDSLKGIDVKDSIKLEAAKSAVKAALDSATVTPTVAVSGTETTLGVSKDAVQKAIDLVLSIAKKVNDSSAKDAITVEKRITITAPDTVAGNNVTASVPADSVKLLIDNKIDKVEVKLADGSVSVPVALLAEGKDFSLKVNKVALADAQSAAETVEELASTTVQPLAAFDYQLNVGGEKKSQFTTPLQVSMKLDPASVKPGITAIYYIDDNDKLTFINSNIAKGVATFKVTHFSQYVAMNLTKTFSDVSEDSWLNDTTNNYLAKGIARLIAKGDSSEHFNPDNTITRAEFAAFIARTLKLDTKDYEGLFSDVKSDAWYAKEVEAVKRAGIIDGVGNNNFAPDKAITREEMAKMIMTAYTKLTGKSSDDLLAGTSSSFSDINDVHEWAQKCVTALEKLGIISGSNGQYKPLDNSTRAQSLKVIIELAEKSGI